MLFSSIQNSHVVGIAGAEVPYVLTGYELIVAYRVGSKYANMAPMDGKVTGINDSVMSVRFSDKTIASYELGYVYGEAEGTTYPHEMITELEYGNKFKKDDPLTWNKAFFTLYPMVNKLMYRSVKMLNVAVYEGTDNYEDSCSMYDKMGYEFSTTVTKVKTNTLTFDQNVHSMVRVGSKVEVDTPLYIIEDSTGVSSLFEEDTIDTLRELTSQTPKAGFKGEVVKIQVYYNGELSDMSKSLRTLVDRSNRSLSELSKSKGGERVTGQVGSEYRIKGDPLDIDQLEIKVFINVKYPLGVGDKVIFGNQLKCTIGRVTNKPMRTIDGRIVEGSFGGKSDAARIVNNFKVVSFASMYLNVLGEHIVKIFNKK